MDLSDVFRVIFALIGVLGMIGLLAIVGPRLTTRLKAINLARTPRRLQLVETLSLDPKRRLAIVRCDGREHLIILGPQSESILDKNLPAPIVDAPDTAQQELGANADDTGSVRSFATVLRENAA